MFDNILPDLVRVLLSCESLECKVDLGTCKVDNGVPLVAAWRLGGSLEYRCWQRGGLVAAWSTVGGRVEAPLVALDGSLEANLVAAWRRLWWQPGVVLVAAWRRPWWQPGVPFLGGSMEAPLVAACSTLGGNMSFILKPVNPVALQS